MRKQYPECPACQTDINASNGYSKVPQYLKDCDAYRPLTGGWTVKDGCDYCVRVTVEGVAKQWLNEGSFEDVAHLLGEYVGVNV